MQKLKMHTPDRTQGSIARLRELFPTCVTEAKDAQGNIRFSVDFDQLKQELSDQTVEGPQERYHLNWPGKREALLTANAPIAKTLRPARSESMAFDTTKHLFVEGDNLDALKLLQETYLGKIKMIYIDPPYNSGKDFLYEDDYASDHSSYFKKSNQVDDRGNKLVTNRESNGRFHSDWLSMLYGRLMIARNLLSDEGIIVISIDEKEHANLKKLCDDVFGNLNFCGEIVWKNSSKNDESYVSMQHEYIVFYAKNKGINKGEWSEKKLGLSEIYSAFEGFRREHGDDWSAIHESALRWYNQFPPSNPIFDSKHYNWMDTRGVYFASDISGPNHGQYVYDVPHPHTAKPCKPPASGWRYPESEMKDRIRDGRVHFGKDHTTIPNNKTYLKDTENQSLTSLRYVDGRAASNRLQELFGMKVFTNPKDELLLSDIMRAVGIGNADIVLDFFAGSGTIAHAVFELNQATNAKCMFIVVQIAEDLSTMLSTATGSAKQVVKNAMDYLTERSLPCTIAEIAKERIRLASKKIRDNNQLFQGDLGFRVLKVDTSNMADVYYIPDSVDQEKLVDAVSNIKPDRNNPEDLLFQVLLDWGVDLTLPIRKEKIQSKSIFFVDDNALAACFDKGITEELVKELAGRAPLRVVFRDSGFESDAVKINTEQIFKQISPTTEVRAI